MNVRVPPTQGKQDFQQDEQQGSPLRKYMAGGAALLLILGGYWYYTNNQSSGNAGRRLQTAAPVKVASAQQRSMAVIESTLGTVMANSSVSVTARVQGQLTKAYFKEGQMVKAGDLLFQIDPAPYQAAYDATLATLAGAKTNAERSARLLKQNAVAPQVDDNNQSLYMQAKANAEAARLNLQFTQIRSPIDGKTGPILLQPGNLVSVNGLTAPLVTITQIHPIKVSLNLPQVDLPRIQARAKTPAGLTAQVQLHDAGGEDISAPVDFISNMVNATSGTIELRATFPNNDDALVPGQLVDVVVQLADLPGAIVVPREAVNTGADGTYIYVVTDGRAVARPVKVAFDDGTNDAITGNVQDGDKVIVDGQLRVVPNGKVFVQGQGRRDAGGPNGNKGGVGGKGKRGGAGAAAGTPKNAG